MAFAFWNMSIRVIAMPFMVGNFMKKLFLDDELGYFVRAVVIFCKSDIYAFFYRQC